ncbi:MAG: GMC oxidoreductase [Halioglobus sp.]|nr:GMC oxidoreductase [Halioglobus sp.]
MPSINRRSFLRRTSLFAAATALPMGCSDGDDKLERTAIVIGSGFAGSVAALRLGLAGIPTVVLERGRQWTVTGPDTFPTTTNFDERSSWTIPTAANAAAGQRGYAGLLENIAGDNVTAVCGACVGGGSLVYGGVLIQPQRDVFESVFPYLSYDEMDAVYYPRVIREIGASPIPDDVLASATYQAHRQFLEDAGALGFEQLRPNTSFDWDIIRQEIAGEIPAAASVSEYAFGCNSDAKLSTDKNYLKNAVATGVVEVRSLTEVEIIRERPGGGYAVVCRNITEQGELLQRYELEADYLFLAAGSMNTSRLLLKSQDAGELRGGNDRVGAGWGTNGDQLLAQSHPGLQPGPQGGPACVAAVDRTDASYPVTFMHSPVAFGVQLQLAMSVPDDLGRLRYDPASDGLLIDWAADTGTPSEQARVASFQRLVAQNGGFEVPFISGSIWHPLGGAPMDDACDTLGQLYGYRNLFVVDGSLLPGSAAAANPALTIAANTERIMDVLIPGLA